MNDEVFFAEWGRRRPDERRDVARAGALARVLGIADRTRPVLSVVGSKGKGTTATYASATLAAAGLHTVTVTSPALRSNTERIRRNGRSVSYDTLSELAERLRAGIAAIGEHRRGYLSPAGLFLLAGVLHGKDTQADALVLEAGMGGISDEISLFPPDVLAISTIFAEHIGVIGANTVEIARDKTSVAAANTRAVLSLPQTDDVETEIVRTLGERAPAAARPVVVRSDLNGLPKPLRPDGLAAANADLGYRSAIALMDQIGTAHPDQERLDTVLGSVILPGRLSWHPAGDTDVLVDAAISRAGIAAALTAAVQRWGRIDHVFVCLPDHKDVSGAVRELAGIDTTFVRLPDTHLAFQRRLPDSWNVIDADALDRAELAAHGAHVVALGTGYFTGRVLDVLDVHTDRLFHCPGTVR